MRRKLDAHSDPDKVPRPNALPVQFAVIPDQLKTSVCWVVWVYWLVNGRWTKPPFSPRTGRNADVTDPTSWGTATEAFDAYIAGGWDGMGVVLTTYDPFIAIDLDHGRDPVSGALTPEAAAVVARIPSYWEVSPSGTGVRAFVEGSLPEPGRRRGNIEMYNSAHYVTVTGHRLGDASNTINACQPELDSLYREVFGREQPQVSIVPRRVQRRDAPLDRSDRAILTRAERAKNGWKFCRLMSGDWKGLGYPSKSEADCALVEFFCFWGATSDAQIDRLFRASALADEKWDRRDYRESTIERARELADASHREHRAHRGAWR